MNLREFIDKFQRCTSHGWLDWDEAILLVAYAELTEGPIVEVGSYFGRSAMLLGQLGRRVYCVDPWDDFFSTDMKGEQIYQRFLANTKGLDVVPVRTKVELWQPVLAEFVYLDGDHSYQGTVNQIRAAKACRPRYVAIHDVAEDGGGAQVRKAAVDTLGMWKERNGKLAVWERP